MIDFLKNYKNILCFFAHPDDETLGAGGLLDIANELLVRKKLSSKLPDVFDDSKFNEIATKLDDIVKIQGLYEEEYSNSGGPFIAFAKFDDLKDEILIVSGFVNNPGKSKNKLLKELEVQIKNIIYEEKYEK